MAQIQAYVSKGVTMSISRKLSATVAMAITLLVAVCEAQFSSNIHGVVMDPSQAVIPSAPVRLRNVNTQVELATQTSSSGVYRFSSLAPGEYELLADMPGFQPKKVAVTLLTAQTADVPIVLEVATATERVAVVAAAPILATSDARTHATIEERVLDDLPLQGRNMLGLATLAPGVTGYGNTSGGAPGNAPDNYSTEVVINVSGNGRNYSGNHYTVDGLNVTSNIIQGVSNLAPNPDSVQEISIQTNAYNVEQGQASSLQVAITTKSGSNNLHGSGSYFFNNQDLYARTVFTQKREPFKKHLFNGTLGGPVYIPRLYDGRNRTFFFASVEGLRSQTSSADAVQTFETEEFVSWARGMFPNSIGTEVLTERRPSGISITKVAKTAADVFGTGPEGCGTGTTYGIPCNLPMINEGRYKPSPFRNGLQANVRGDQYLNDNKDRIYFNFYDTDLDIQTLGFREGFATVDDNFSHAIQANWTHTFNPSILNEFSFGWIKVQGNRGLDPTIPTYIPDISIQGQSLGIAPAWGPATFIQNNYNWRNVVSVIKGGHTLKFGFQAWTGNDDALFNDVNGRTSFFFQNLLELVTDNPFTQGGPLIDPLTGKEGPGGYEHLLTTFGFFVQDEWKVRPNLTLSLGLRFDDYGNITRDQTKGVPLGNLFLDKKFRDLNSPQEIDQVFTVARMKEVDSGVYDGRITNVWSPRVGVAWDPLNNGNWVVRGGFGVYHDWIPLGEANRIRGNPPGLLRLELRRGDPIGPTFSLGTSNRFPYGWVLPELPAKGVNEYGGIEGIRSNTGALDRYMRPPNTYNFTIGVERRLPSNVVAGAMYSGSRTRKGPWGSDYNRFAGDLLDGKFDRLHQSFGTIYFETNRNEINYNAMILSLRGRVGQWANLQGSYTYSKVEDFGQAGTRVNRDPGNATPTQHEISRFLAPSDWDFRHRASIGGVVNLPSLSSSTPAVKAILGGWELSSVCVLQSGPPFNVFTSAPFRPITDSGGSVIGLQANSGDFNADGVNFDFPNQPSQDFTGSHERQEYINGLFKVSDFPLPAPGTLGDLPRMYYRGPGFINFDLGVIKNNRLPFLGDQGNLQLRFEFFNVLNRVNLGNVNGNLSSSTFGRSTSQFDPRIIQLGGRITF